MTAIGPRYQVDSARGGFGLKAALSSNDIGAAALYRPGRNDRALGANGRAINFFPRQRSKAFAGILQK